MSNPTFRPRLNHVAISVDPALLDELHAIVGRAKTYGERDDRVRVIDVHARTTEGPQRSYVLTSAYIGFVLPLMIELQHLAAVPH